MGDLRDERLREIEQIADDHQSPAMFELLAEVRRLRQQVPYDRDDLVSVLTYHWNPRSTCCSCGWPKWDASYAEHVADVYEASAPVNARRKRAKENRG